VEKIPTGFRLPRKRFGYRTPRVPGDLSSVHFLPGCSLLKLRLVRTVKLQEGSNVKKHHSQNSALLGQSARPSRNEEPLATTRGWLTRATTTRQTCPDYICRAGRRRFVIGETNGGGVSTVTQPPDWCKSSRVEPPLRLGAKARTALPGQSPREQLIRRLRKLKTASSGAER
jgi:hypothetical protein